MAASLKIVKVSSPDGPYYSLRKMVDDESDREGFEVEFARAKCRNKLEAYKSRAASLDDVSITFLCALGEILPLAEMIQDANCDQGCAGYATKSHMASWAAQIDDIIARALEACGYLDLCDRNPHDPDRVWNDSASRVIPIRR